jgi:hypothetical protein
MEIYSERIEMDNFVEIVKWMSFLLTRSQTMCVRVYVFGARASVSEELYLFRNWLESIS